MGLSIACSLGSRRLGRADVSAVKIHPVSGFPCVCKSRLPGCHGVVVQVYSPPRRFSLSQRSLAPDLLPTSSTYVWLCQQYVVIRREYICRSISSIVLNFPHLANKFN